jgi:uncharacterized protein (DUF302 family)
MDRAISATSGLGFDAAVGHIRALLAEQGFGVLTEIDVQATLREKLGVDMGRYLILGACNPPLAHEALSIDPEIGLLLPCNVVVRETDEGVLVQAMNPQLLVEMTGRTSLEPTAQQAAARLVRALEALGDADTTPTEG